MVSGFWLGRKVRSWRISKESKWAEFVQKRKLREFAESNTGLRRQPNIVQGPRWDSRMLLLCFHLLIFLIHALASLVMSLVVPFDSRLTVYVVKMLNKEIDRLLDCLFRGYFRCLKVGSLQMGWGVTISFLSLAVRIMKYVST